MIVDSSHIDEGRRSAWPPKALVVAMVLAAILGAGAGVRAPDVGYQLGAAVGTALIVWAAVWFGFLRKRHQLKPWAAYLWLYAATATAGIGVALYQTSQAEIAKTSLAEAIEHYAAGERSIKTSSAASGDLGSVEALTKEALRTAANDRRDYAAEMEGAGLGALFTNETLGRVDWLARAQITLQRAGEISAKYRALGNERRQEFRARAEQLAVSSSTKTSLIAAVEESDRKKAAMVDRSWDIEDEVLAEASKAIDLLASAEGRWRIEGGELQFDRQSDLDAFNGHFRRMTALVAEQEAIHGAHIESMRAAGGLAH